ncbi:hypothetical protein GGF43_001923, partial [Coemansia sp. RSA 2618]
MELPGLAQAAPSNKTRQITVTLRPGACTVVDWMASTAADEPADDAEHASSQSDSDSSDDGYTSNAGQVPPAIANDPFFAQILRNAEMREASEKKKKAAKRGKRRAKDAADDLYDLEDPFIDDSELTVMDGHNYAQMQQRKKRRKRDDGSNTETEAAAAAEGADADAPTNAVGEDAIPSLEDLDKYEEDDFFVYHGPLNELAADESDDDSAAAPAKSARPRKRPEKKQAPKEPAAGKKKANGAAGAKGDASDAGAKKKADASDAGAKKKAETKAQHRRSGSDTAPAGGPQVPSNGRKSGPRTSRKLDQGKSASSVSASGDDAKLKRPPIPERDKAVNGAALSSGKKAEAASAEAVSAADSATAKDDKPPPKRAGAQVSGAAVSSIVVAPDDSKAFAEARMATPEIEAALTELAQATQGEAFTNRQRFPSSLKPALRQVCELSMARALEYDREILALTTPEHTVFAWTTPLDIVGFTTDIYHRLSSTLPYNRATVRKIVSKLLGHDLLTWKEQQLKQIEEGLKMRVDEQIERNMGWIPVGARAKDGDDSAAAGGSQVRWHWTTLSKHILFQYMVLTLNINELRNSLDQGPGKDGGYREQQARKDAYAHLVNLWPGSSMSTYEISRAYSSRKSLLEKQSKRADSGAAQSQAGSDKQPAATEGTPAASAMEESPAQKTPEPAAAAVDLAAGVQPAHEAPSAFATAPTHQSMSPYVQIDHVASSPRNTYPHFDYSNSPSSRFGDAPRNQASPLQSLLYDNGLPGQFPDPAHSHRSLDF